MTPKRTNIILKVTLGVLILVILGGLYFSNKKLTALATDTSRLKADIEISQKQITAYQATKAKVDSLDYVDELANKVLPQDKEQSAIVAELSQFALRARLSVAEINFPDKPQAKSSSKTKSATPKGVDVMPITIKFKEDSKYESILTFLRSVEDNRRKMQVTNISLKPDEEDRQKIKEVTVDINLYTRSQAIQKETK